MQPACILCDNETELPKQFTGNEGTHLTTSSPILIPGIITEDGFAPYVFQPFDETEEDFNEPKNKQPEFLTTPTMDPPE